MARKAKKREEQVTLRGGCIASVNTVQNDVVIRIGFSQPTDEFNVQYILKDIGLGDTWGDYHVKS